MPLAKLELATLDIPPAPAHGVQPQPAEKYEAEDPSGYVVVTVDPQRMVTNVRIRPHWIDHLKPEAFPAALYNTYVSAVQRAMAAEVTRISTPPSTPAQREEDLTGLPAEDWARKMTARLDALDSARAAVLRSADRPPASADVRSPLGYLTLRMRAGGPVAITADPHVLRNPSESVLSNDIQQMFVLSGLGIEAASRPRPARPRDDSDDDYFSAVNVFDDRD